MTDERMWVTIKYFSTKWRQPPVIEDDDDDGYSPDVYGFRLPFEEFKVFIRDKAHQQLVQLLLEKYPTLKKTDAKDLEIKPSGISPPRFYVLRKQAQAGKQDGKTPRHPGPEEEEGDEFYQM